MNAIIALCHFCDHHGPTTLFCTQAFRYSDYQQTRQNKSDHNITHSNESNEENIEILINSSSSSSTHPNSMSPTLPEFDPSLQVKPAQVNFQLSPTNETTTSTKTSNKNNIDSCQACKAFGKDFHHYISYDDSACLDAIKLDNNTTSSFNTTSASAGVGVGGISNRICYLSQSSPIDSEVFSLVRKACLRTLHCEVFEDPIYFDDDQNGSVIGYEFNIKDSEGRGFQRSYSIIMIMKDRIYLQHLWSFLYKQMSIIASNIKQEAEKKFEKDMTDKGIYMQCLNQSSPIHSSNSSRLVNFKKNSKLNRGLIDLTDDDLIFAKLHMWFTWILRMSACQVREEFIHGPLTEDLQVKLEQEKLKESLMDKDKSLNDEFILDLTDNNPNNNLDKTNKNLNTIYGLFVNTSLSELNCFNTTNNKQLNENDKLSIHEYLVNNLQFDNLRQFLKLIGKEKFHQIAYHTIVGNQVIVRGKFEKLVSSIIRLLEELIPFGCCKSSYYSMVYLKSYECKLLGLCDKVKLSNDSDDELYNVNDLNEYILVDLVVESILKEDNLKLPIVDLTYNNLVNLIDFKVDFNLRTNVKQINQVPSILIKIESFLLNDNLDDISTSSLIKTSKEEWLNKTKVFYKFIQSPHVKSTVKTETILEILKLNKNDELALKYWQAGLSSECKYQIRAS